MGSYLSQPEITKFSSDEVNEFLKVGASSMQGWRNSQEDAHNALLTFDTNTAFFAVYDGHGGAEVATYCADKLPTFLKNLESYKRGDYETALKEAFLGFDKTLLEPEVVEMLKILAGDNKPDNCNEDLEDDDDDEEEENLAELHEESNLALSEVLQRYNSGLEVPPSAENAIKNENDGPLSMPNIKRLRDGNGKPQSPYLRGRRAAAVAADAANKAALDPDVKVAGASTSAAAAAALNASGASCSKFATSSVKLDAEEDSTVSSSSSSASKSNNTHNNNNNHQAAEAEAIKEEQLVNGEVASVVKNDNIVSGDAPDSSHVIKENEQNGNVTSSEPKKLKDNVTTTTPKCTQQTSEDSTVSGSSDTTETKQNGNLVSSASSPSSSGLLAAGSPVKMEPAVISSTSKEKIKHLTDDDSTDDDVDYDGEGSDDDEDGVMAYSSDDEFEEDDDEDESNYHGLKYDEAEFNANKEFCGNMIEEPGKDSGCTAVVALLHGRDLYVANAGDSRCVVCRNGRTIEMSLDHKPEDEIESKRIINAGGRVTADGRVNGGLNLSRAIGDHAYKTNSELSAEYQMISALPDIKKLIISPEDEFMVLACDGIWNFMSSEEVVGFVRARLTDSIKTSKICEDLFDHCLAPNTVGDGTGCDNMTAVIIRFKPEIYKLSTSINPNETEKEIDSDSNEKTLKRIASSSLDENEQNSKRLKTDTNENGANNASSIASSTTITTTTSSQSNTMTSTTSVLSTSTEAELEAESSEATAAPTL